MRTRKLTRWQKLGGRPAVSRYREKQMRKPQTAIAEAFSNAYEKARQKPGSPGRESAPQLGKEGGRES